MSKDKEMKELSENEDQNDTAVSSERREALKKMGKLAAYTPPTMVTLLVSKRATAASVFPPPPPTAG